MVGLVGGLFDFCHALHPHPHQACLDWTKSLHSRGYISSDFSLGCLVTHLFFFFILTLFGTHMWYLLFSLTIHNFITCDLLQRQYLHDKHVEGMTMTKEMLSPTFVARQVNLQIALAKESKNLQFAWDLSAKIRNSQMLLSIFSTTKHPLMVKNLNLLSLKGDLGSTNVE